MREIDRS